jgi:hypothetical protein
MYFQVKNILKNNCYYNTSQIFDNFTELPVRIAFIESSVLILYIFFQCLISHSFIINHNQFYFHQIRSFTKS